MNKIFKPKIDFNSRNQISYKEDQKILEKDVKEENADFEVIDKILVCPECGGLPTVRLGCASCGSHKISPDLLVHHYACGNVDFLRFYLINKDEGSLTCPKCHKEHLIINCDYDVSHGLQRCQECGWTGNSAKLIGECSICSTRFLIDEADEIELKQYLYH